MARIITERKLKYEIPEGKSKERIDLFLTNSIENATRSKVQKLIKEGLVEVNGKKIKPNYLVNPGDLIIATVPIAPRPDETEPEDIPIDIVYEDEYFLIVNKPPGMVVHPAIGNYTGTLVNALLHYTKNLSSLNDPARPGIVHRIDKGTSGLLVVAKDEWTHAMLSKQFSAHTIEREYWAICWGIPKVKEGEIIGNISRYRKDKKKFAVTEDEGKHAHTFYKVLESHDFTSLVSLKLKTGRTHQIRVHLSHINHPVFGDDYYGGRKISAGWELPRMKSRVNNLLKLIDRQALHAKTLGLYHPHKKEFMRFDSNPAEDFTNLLEVLREQSSMLQTYE